MIWPGIESAAQIAVERVLNSLPEGVLIAVSAWLLLRVMGRQNSGTRFAVWMIALLGVAALPLLGGAGTAGAVLRVHAPIAVPAFWAVAFFAVWAIAACAALARVAAGLWQVRRLRRNCTEASAAEFDPALQEIIGQTRRPVRLMISEEVRVPSAVGFLHPAIVLPAWALRDLSVGELKPILIHELAHLRRRDDWTNLLQKAVRAVLFFHPAVWWIDARLSIEREMACDDAVLAETGNPKGYAGCLIGLLEKSCTRRGWTMAQAAVARARDASLRIARILHAGAPASTRVGRPALALVGAACVTCCGILLCAPRLLVFAPVSGGTQEAAASIRTRGEAVLDMPARVVPAAFHPVEQPTLMHKAVVRRKVTKHAATQPSIAMAQPPANPVPLVRASLSEPEASGARATAPLLLVVQMVQTAYDPATVAQASAADPSSMEKSTAGAAQPRMLQTAVQVETVQIVESDGANYRIHWYRLVLIVPAQNMGEPGSISHSI